jgi:hypothetical protein
MARKLWDLCCPFCGLINEDVLCSDEEIAGGCVSCADCGSVVLEKILTPPARIGAREDRPVTMHNIGKSFTSEAELKKYEKETGTYAATPSETKEYVDRKRRKLDDMARSRGHKSVEAYQNIIRERKKDSESNTSRIIST